MRMLGRHPARVRLCRVPSARKWQQRRLRLHLAVPHNRPFGRRRGMSECGNSPKKGWHLWVPGNSQKIGKTPVCYWCGKRKDQKEDQS